MIANCCFNFVHILTATLVRGLWYQDLALCLKLGIQLNVVVGIDFQKSELMTNAFNTAQCSQVQYLMPSPS